MSTPIQVLDAADVRRTIARIAYEVLERNRGSKDLVVVGILRHGAPIGKRLAFELARIEGGAIPHGSIDPRPFRDDAKRSNEDASDIPFDLSGKRVVLVDEVIHTGRTIRASMDGLMKHGRPASIQLAVLVDRGGRELPIAPDYVGKTLTTESGDFVCVETVDLDGEDRVTVLSREQSG